MRIILATVALIALSSTSFAETPKIGSTISTQNTVEAVVDGTNKSLTEGSPIHIGDVVRAETGTANIKFLDGSTLDIGPLSEIRFNSDNSGKVIIEVTRGVIRFATNNQRHYQFTTPFGTLNLGISNPPESF